MTPKERIFSQGDGYE